MSDQPITGGSTSWMPNLTRAARLLPLGSHRRLRQVAAGACTADWPTAGSWEATALTEGEWIDGDPAEAARWDSADEVSEAWDLGAIEYGGDAHEYRRRGDQIEVPFEENGRRCRVIASPWGTATVCDEEGSW